MEESTSCIFCDIAAGRADAYTVYEDETTMCILDIHPYTRATAWSFPRGTSPGGTR